MRSSLRALRLSEAPETPVLPRVAPSPIDGWRLGEIVLAGALAGAAVSAGWLLPQSPIALWRADAVLALYGPLAATEAYDDVARFTPFQRLRELALLRSASLWAADLGDPLQASRRLDRIIDSSLPVERRADASERLAEIALSAGDLDRAARAFQEAWRLDPKGARAADRLIRAARLRMEGGEHTAAQGLWERVARSFPAFAAEAWISQAEMVLAEGRPKSALLLYQQALTEEANPALVEAAHLGAASCLERIGDATAAVAELRLAGLPEAALADRIASLEKQAKAERFAEDAPTASDVANRPKARPRRTPPRP